MIGRWLLASCASCVTLGGAIVGARAAVYDLTSSGIGSGEGSYTFKETFDTDKPGAGTGTIHFDPIEAEYGPFTDCLTNLTYTIMDAKSDGDASPIVKRHLSVTGANGISSDAGAGTYDHLSLFDCGDIDAGSTAIGLGGEQSAIFDVASGTIVGQQAIDAERARAPTMPMAAGPSRPRPSSPTSTRGCA